MPKKIQGGSFSPDKCISLKEVIKQKKVYRQEYRSIIYNYSLLSQESFSNNWEADKSDIQVFFKRYSHNFLYN